MKTTDIPSSVPFRIKRGLENGHRVWYILVRTESKWKQIDKFMVKKDAIDRLADMWGELLGTEI